MFFIAITKDSHNKFFRATCPALGVAVNGISPEEAKANLANEIQRMLKQAGQLFGVKVDGDTCQFVELNQVISPSDTPTDEIVFFIPTKLTRPFFANLLEECETQINEQFGDSLRPIIRYVPRDKIDGIQTASLLKKEFRQSSQIRVVVIVPTESEKLTKDVANLCRKLESVPPVIALTLPFANEQKIFQQYNVRRPITVYCDGKSASEKLGKYAAKRLSNHVRKVTVLMVEGHPDRKDSNERIDGFWKGLVSELRVRLKIPKESITRHKIKGNWHREKAKKAFMNFVENHLTSELQLVFAANDDMAIAINEAIDDMDGATYRLCKNCSIFGFDSIPEMERLVDKTNSRIKGTVEQPSKEIAQKLVEVLEEVLSKSYTGSKNLTRLVGVKPNFGKNKANNDYDIPPYVKNSDDWSTTHQLREDGKTFFGKTDTLKKLDTHVRQNRKEKILATGTDEHGEFGVHGSRTIRKYRIVDGTVFWWVGDPVWRQKS